MKNTDPSEPWNESEARRTDPTAPWNEPGKENDPSACWNDPSGQGEYRDEVDRRYRT